MSKVGIVRTSRCYSVRDATSDDEWDRGDDQTEHEVTGLRLNGSSDVIDTSFDVKVGDFLYLVYATYDTGDTFGTNYGYGFEAFSLHMSEKLAESNADIIRHDTGNSLIILDDETEIPVSAPWHGYFESLQGVHVERFQVEK